MSLAGSWVDEPATPLPSGQLYDESEEYDEVDESEDGCAGVVWQPYVLQKPHSSNTMLHELAREVRGVEQKRGKQLRVTDYKKICLKWEDASRPFLRKGYDSLTEFLAKLDRVTIPKGETLNAAFLRAKHRQPPSKVLVVSNKGLWLFASLCHELQEMLGDKPIMLCQTSIAKLFTVSQQTISKWISALKTLGVLKLAEAAIPNARAARYYFIK